MTQLRETAKPSRLGLLLLAVILSYAAWTHLPTLDHPYLPGWDEAVHAAVAGNLVKHPLTPTLFDQPFILYDIHNWQANHVWLHMPPLPFWQAAAGMAIGGRSFFSLRFPSLLLFLLTIGLVYALGFRLYDEATGLLGASLMAVIPFAWLQVQGYFFGDMTDVSLAFWLLAGTLAIRQAVVTGRIGWAAFSGLLMGLGLLTKSGLALAPTGALVALWLAGTLRFELSHPVRWFVPAVHLAVGILPYLAWLLYASCMWPAEFQYEQAAQWAHVFSNYEGHARPWDAVYNDLLAILLMPQLVLAALASTVTLLLLAFKSRRSGTCLHALWILGTLLPLSFVQTKVPALLFGLLPALALAMARLFIQAARAGAGPWLIAAALNPAVFATTVDWMPTRIWTFAQDVTPAMAIWPHLPIQAMLFLVSSLILVALRTAWTRWAEPESGIDRLARLIGRILVRVVILVPFVILLRQHVATREGFRIIQDYNPVARTVASMKPMLPDRAAVVIEGVPTGRQRQDLTCSVLTGLPAHTVRGHRLESTLPAARKLGVPFLITPRKRDDQHLLAPGPGSGYWVYQVESGIPKPVVLDPAEALARYPIGPDLLRLEPGSTSVTAGNSLQMLAIWHLAGPVQAFDTRILLHPESGGPGIPVFPKPEDFPLGNEAVHLHSLAPPGLLWGKRPLGTGLAEPHRYRQGEVFADAFQFWVPRHLAPGSYRVRLELLRHNRPQPPQSQVDWPLIEVGL